MTNQNSSQNGSTAPWDMFARPAGKGGAGGQQQQQQRLPRGHLVSFRAGKLNRDGPTWVRPDRRRGQLYVQQTDDGLMHVCWRERTAAGGAAAQQPTAPPEDDLIVFPDEAEFVAVPQRARVYVLRFKQSQQRLFFWMQEPSDARDAELVAKVNRLLNSPPQPGAAAAGGGDEDADMDGEALDLSALGGGDQEQLMRLLAAQGLIPEDALAGLTGAGAGIGDGAASAPAAANSGATQSTQLSSALTPELLAPIVADASLRQRLFPFMPADHEHTPASLREVIASAPFREAVQQLQAAIESGEMGPLVQELGLDPAVVQGRGDRVLALLRAIRDKKQGGGGGDRMDES